MQCKLSLARRQSLSDFRPTCTFQLSPRREAAGTHGAGTLCMLYPARRVQGFEDCDFRVRRRVCALSLVVRLKPLKRLPTGARPLFKDAATHTTPAPRSPRLPHDALTRETFFPCSSLSAGWADQINHANCAAYARTPQSRASRKWGPECLT